MNEYLTTSSARLGQVVEKKKRKKDETSIGGSLATNHPTSRACALCC